MFVIFESAKIPIFVQKRYLYTVKRFLLIAFLILAAASVADLKAQSKRDSKASAAGNSQRGISHYTFEIEPNGDTLAIINLMRVHCFSNPVDMSKHRKLVRDFRRVYPLAQVARQTMAGFEQELLALPTRKAQREFSKRTEKALVEQYTPTMKRMTVSQGKILVRLIDRETEMTLVKEFRGGFVAGFWQGIARIFGHNLKDEYDPAERDRIIEQCIMLYNVGLLPEY